MDKNWINFSQRQCNFILVVLGFYSKCRKTFYILRVCLFVNGGFFFSILVAMVMSVIIYSVQKVLKICFILIVCPYFHRGNNYVIIKNIGVLCIFIKNCHYRYLFHLLFLFLNFKKKKNYFKLIFYLKLIIST